ncbi:MAG: hypothetical protein IJH00_03410 [Erysipelotrichaceae bacterium]|nr:hypothetical protein [Erysipelotrichaceae bacterium]MBQ6493163.1 hypothetical protein [Erysipelotrichaceae bacterium]
MYGQYTDEMRMMSFDEVIRDYISDKLDEFEGNTYYASDLASEITMEDNTNGTMFAYTQDARDFINDHPNQAAETYEYYREIGMDINPFQDPDTYSFYMGYYGVDQMLNRSEYITRHWDEQITLTPDVIEQIKQDLGIEIEQPQQYETFYGYIYDDNGMHGDPILFEANSENISLFVMNNQFNQTVVTDSMDSFVVSSLPGGFLDRVCNEETRQQILDHLLPYQQGEKFPMTFPVEEMLIEIGDKTVNVQFNSDRDFDYTIYSKDLSELDGGIIDNTHHLDSIPGSVYESIRDMHHLEGEIVQQEIHGLQHDEALYRMESLRLKEDIIDNFKNGELWQSTSGGDLYRLSEDQDLRVLQFEENNNCTVYHVVHDEYTMTDGTKMEMENYLYVSDSMSEWKEDREILKEGFAYSYVNNLTYPEFSELGEIGVAPRDGGLIRNDRGYDFTVMSAHDLADKIDQYNLHHDPLSYAESEYYQDKGFDEMISAVRHNDFEKITDDLRAEISNNGPMSDEAKEILSDIDAYSKDYEIHMDNGMDLKGGMSL